MAKWVKREAVNLNTLKVIAAVNAAYAATGGDLVNVITDEQPIPTRSYFDQFIADETSLDLTKAQTDIDYLHGSVTMALFMGRKVNDFTRKLLDKVSEEEVTDRDINFLMYFPRAVTSAKKYDAERDTVVECGSEFIGQPGDKITFQFTVIKTRYVQSVDRYIVLGKTEAGNLVQYWTNKNELLTSGKYTAKIKSHDQNQYTDHAKVTSVNFVKVAK